MPYLSLLGRAFKRIIRLMRNLLLKHSVTSFSLKKQILFLRNKENKIGYCFPYDKLGNADPRQLHILKNGFHKHLLRKYTDSGYEIDHADTVLDCGAFVGGFSVAAILAGAKKLIAVEPSSRNRRCLEINLCLYGIENAKVLPIGLGEATRVAQLNLSKSACDDSFLSPDVGATGQSEEVLIRTISEIVEMEELEPKHLFLKVEAEGFEPEVIRGLGSVRPRIIVVDVTPERDGQSPREEIHRLLENWGYQEFHSTERCLFAKISS